MPKKRVLIMCHSLTGGGAERVAALWASGFVERGFEVGFVLNCRKNVPITYPLPDKVHIYNIWSFFTCRLFNYKWKDNILSIRVKKVVSDFNPDIIIGVMNPWAEWAYMATKGMGIPIVNTEHDAFERPACSPFSEIAKIRKFEWNKHYQLVTVLTDADRKSVKGILSNVVVLHNPLAYKPASSLPFKKKIILAAGRLDAWHYKGFDLLINAWGNISKLYPDWTLVIAGRDRKNAKKYLQKIADENSIGNRLVFPGYNDNILDLYKEASIFVLSSRYEGFGMVLIEAMSQGCAPIACDFKGRQQEIISSSDQGIICQTESITALSEAMAKMIEDDEFRKTCQLKAIERSGEFALSNVMDRWEKILDKLW